MKGRRAVMAGVAVIVVALMGAYRGYAAHAGEPAPSPVTAPVTAPVVASSDTAAAARGAKLAAVGDCVSCHTATGGQPLAGGLPLQTPFGVIYSTNITPDDDTGIGRWSLDAFARAMRRGVSSDGHLLYPAFPYPHFTHINDADIGSLYAWLMSRAPISAPTPHNELIFPLGFRPIMAVWNLLYLHTGDEAAPSPSEASDVARGRYLVESLGHCGACHTPLNRLGAERRDRALQGGTIEGWDAPALTDLAARPTPWTQAQLVSYLRTGLASEHGAAAGSMRPVTRMLADASASDVDAISAYLLALPAGARSGPEHAVASPPASAASVPVSTSPRSGANLFAAACASCHAQGAPMSTDGARPPLSLSTAVNADSPRNTVRIILDGIDWHESDSAPFMPSFANTFTDAQIAELANYTRERFTARGSWPSLDADAVAHFRKDGLPR
ncbi:mono/diheme cytochrome c family protein [Paraburkholderia sp. WC7.3g]|uniref:C-type cytochrome n=1 Tax=Paraburkholderia podalyriae TaxID=1938811 RepID=A0ABR7PIV5_9BURK|nr:cytochrome c [Paraburkholderia podalyriae]MBC8746307.1 c-type cytochrome [Paraburkholderia podalyriae]